MSKNPSSSQLERQLRDCTREYDAIKTRIHDIGFICTGSLVKRWMICGKPNCHCRTSPEERHGPYYQLTWKEEGVTISRRLPPKHAKLYEEWIANRQRLDALVSQLHRVSVKAARHLLSAATDSASEPEEPPQRSRSTNQRR